MFVAGPVTVSRGKEEVSVTQKMKRMIHLLLAYGKSTGESSRFWP